MIGHTSGLVRTPEGHQSSLKTKVGVPVFPVGFPGLAVRLDDSFTVYENTNTIYTNRVDTTDENDEVVESNRENDEHKEAQNVETPKVWTKRHIIYEGQIILYSKTPPYVETYKMYQGLTPGISKIPVTNQPIRAGINFDEITNISSTTTTTEIRSDEFYDKNAELCTDVKNNCCYYIVCCGLCCE